MNRRCICLASALAISTHTAFAISLEVNATADTYITQSAALDGPTSTHYGDTGLWAIGAPDVLSFPLVYFDLSSYRGAAVTGTPQLQLWLEGGAAAGDDQPRSVGIYASAVTWRDNVKWDTFGGSPGVNFGTETGPLLATQTDVVWPGGGGRYITWDLPETLVQSWIDSPPGFVNHSNPGLLVRNLTETPDRDLRFSAEDGSNEPRLTFDVAARFGDFNNDAKLNGSDIDLLLSQPSGSVPPGDAQFDLNGDGFIITGVNVPNSDVDLWVHDAAHTLYGDTDFDGQVIFDDLLRLASNYGRSRGWEQGNFDGQNGVDFSDLLLLAQHYGQSAVNLDALPANFAAEWALAQSMVPEPTAVLGAATGLVLFRRRVRRPVV